MLAINAELRPIHDAERELALRVGVMTTLGYSRAMVIEATGASAQDLRLVQERLPRAAEGLRRD